MMAHNNPSVPMCLQCDSFQVELRCEHDREKDSRTNLIIGKQVDNAH